MIGVILAGGLGTRLRSVVSDKPKVLAEVLGRPFVELILEQLFDAAITKVILCTGYMGEQIREHFGNFWHGQEILYSQESQPLGTAGAVRLALPLMRASSALVMNGDSLYQGSLEPLIAVHKENQERVTILLSRTENASRYGTVEIASNGEVQSFVEKDSNCTRPAWVSAGIYLMQTECIEMIPTGLAVSLEKEVFPGLIGRGLYGVAGTGEFLDIGTPEAYGRAQEFFRTGLGIGRRNGNSQAI
jgi:D-glycero-alpha-D-manno-heptose 1-phosphate guanylyltransferase